MPIKNIVFDYNGTLVDDHTVSHAVANVVFRRLGLKELSIEEYRKEITHPYMEFWKKFTDTPKEAIEQLYKEELVNMPQLVPLLPEVHELLTYCTQEGIHLAILSGYDQDKIEQELRDMHLRSYFIDVAAGVHDKEPAMKALLLRNNFKPEETIFIGDSAYDMKTGREAGVITVGVTYGYEAPEHLQREQPLFMIDNLLKLKRIIEKEK